MITSLHNARELGTASHSLHLRAALGFSASFHILCVTQERYLEWWHFGIIDSVHCSIFPICEISYSGFRMYWRRGRTKINELSTYAMHKLQTRSCDCSPRLPNRYAACVIKFPDDVRRWICAVLGILQREFPAFAGSEYYLICRKKPTFGKSTSC